MKPQDKKFILENRGRLSVEEIARQRNLKERSIRRFLETQKETLKPPEKDRVEELVFPRFFLPSLFLVLLVLGGLIYSNTVHSSFHYDDVPEIVENPLIRELPPE